MQVELPDKLVKMTMGEVAHTDPSDAVAAQLVLRLAYKRGRREAERVHDTALEHRYVAEERDKIESRLGLRLWERNEWGALKEDNE